MRKTLLNALVSVGLALPGGAAAQEAAAGEPAKPAPDAAAVKSDASYALGLRTGDEFAHRSGSFGITPDDLDMTRFIEGFMAGFKREETGVDEEKLDAAMQALGDLLQARETEVAASNLQAGKEFLEKNGAREGVTTLKSGLQYEVLSEGGSERYTAPKEGQPDKQFHVNLRGTLIDGRQFDASPEGEPRILNLQVVPGMKEALTIMPVGAKWRIFLPSELAYGDQRRSIDIGPNSVLIFELELVKIEDLPPHPGGIIPGATQGGGN